MFCPRMLLTMTVTGDSVAALMMMASRRCDTVSRSVIGVQYFVSRWTGATSCYYSASVCVCECSGGKVRGESRRPTEDGAGAWHRVVIALAYTSRAPFHRNASCSPTNFYSSTSPTSPSIPESSRNTVKMLIPKADRKAIHELVHLCNRPENPRSRALSFARNIPT